jgi:hypothetical protein
VRILTLRTVNVDFKLIVGPLVMWYRLTRTDVSEYEEIF